MGWSGGRLYMIAAFLYYVSPKWFIGMLQVQFKGRPETWNSGVQIKKCRYLEASGCVALCVNLCKVGRLTDQ